MRDCSRRGGANRDSSSRGIGASPRAHTRRQAYGARPARSKQLPINFVGNMEARELISGKYDVIVSDGFAGNVALKATEGAAMFVMNMLKESIAASTKAKIGYLFMKDVFKQLKKKMDYQQHGGSLFLGCKKNILKAHGDSDENSFFYCIRQAVQISQNDINSVIEKELEKLESQEE